MKKMILLLIVVILYPDTIYAQRGCCSHHGGVSGCSLNGRQICNDGTSSPTCTCTPTYIYGCTDKKAKNYNYNANRNDDSCIYESEEPVIFTDSEINDNYEKSNYLDDNQQESTFSDEDNDENNNSSNIIGLGLLGTMGYFFMKKRKK